MREAKTLSTIKVLWTPCLLHRPGQAALQKEPLPHLHLLLQPEVLQVLLPATELMPEHRPEG